MKGVSDLKWRPAGGTSGRMRSAPANPRENVWLKSLAIVSPIILGYIPIGFAYGVLAKSQGLSGFNTLAMSVLVFAGSSQLIAVGLFGAGASAASIILTTFVVNLRHLLMSAALAPHLKGWTKPFLALFAFELTDESFAVHSARFPKGGAADRGETFRINVLAQAAWVCGTALGVLAGDVITDVRPIALDYALPAMFIALLVGQLKGKTHVFAALAAGAVSTGLTLLGVTQWGVIIATVTAALAATAWKEWTRD